MFISILKHNLQREKPFEKIKKVVTIKCTARLGSSSVSINSSGKEATVNSKKCTCVPGWQMSLILSFVCNCHVLNQLPNHYFYKKHLIDVHHNQVLWNSSYFINSGIAPKSLLWKMQTYDQYKSPQKSKWAENIKNGWHENQFSEENYLALNTGLQLISYCLVYKYQIIL